MPSGSKMRNRLQEFLDQFVMPRNRAERRRFKRSLQLPSDYRKVQSIKWQREHPEEEDDGEAV